MLTAEDNALLTRVEGAAPMGQLFRKHWLPACMSEEIAEPDGAPIRVRLLGEDLVAFRDSNGRVGVLDEHCPHRRASLVLGRNEECGLRCLYHGWKIDIEGRIVDMPSEPPGSKLMERVRHRAYPVRESGGLIWVYLGAQDEAITDFKPPPWADANFAISKMIQGGNWAQVVEGAIDSAHSSSLHSSTIRQTKEGERTAAENDGKLTFLTRPSTDRAPRIQVQLTDYGFRYAAIRKPSQNADKNDYVRITVFIAPFLSLIPPTAQWSTAHMHVPVDDVNTIFYSVGFSRQNAIDQEMWRTRSGARVGIEVDESYRSIRNLSNNYLQDRALMKQGHFSGIQGISVEDQAVTETMGPITDRTRETLGTSDIAIVRFRDMMLRAVRAYQAGQPALGTRSEIARSDIRAFEGMVPKGLNWRTLATTERELASYDGLTDDSDKAAAG